MGHHHHKHHHHKHLLHKGQSSSPGAYYPPAGYPNVAPLVVPYPAAVPPLSGPPVPYSYAAQIAAPPYYSTIQPLDDQLSHALADVQRHARNERIAEVGAAAAGAFAMYEMHEAKVDPAHARRHKLEAELAGAVALGAAGYAYHEHREKQKSERIVQDLTSGGSRHGHKHHNDGHGKKHHHHFW